MRRVRHDDLATLPVVAAAVIGHDHGDPGKLALRASHGCQRHATLHAGHLGEDFLQFVHALQEPLAERLGGIGMALGKPRQQRHRMANARVVFHRARTQRIKVGIDRQVLAAQIGVMAHHLQLGNLRQADRRIAQGALRQIGGYRYRRRKLRRGRTTGLRLLKDQHGLDPA